MNKIAQASREALEIRRYSLDKIIEEFGGIVTINGLGYTNYKGDTVPVFSFVEGEGAVFWGSCKKLAALADTLKTLYNGNLQAINEGFRHTGIKIKIEPTIKLENGRNFRPVSRLGEVDFDEPPADDIACDEETGEVISDSDDDFIPDADARAEVTTKTEPF